MNNQSNLLSRSRVKQTVICVSCVFSQPGDAADINQADDDFTPYPRWRMRGFQSDTNQVWAMTWRHHVKALPWNDSSSRKQVPQRPEGSCMHHTVYSPLSSGCVNIVEQNREFAGGSPTGVTAMARHCLRPNSGLPHLCSPGTRLWYVRSNENPLLTVQLSSPQAVLAFFAN